MLRSHGDQPSDMTCFAHAGIRYEIAINKVLKHHLPYVNISILKSVGIHTILNQHKASCQFICLEYKTKLEIVVRGHSAPLTVV